MSFTIPIIVISMNSLQTMGLDSGQVAFSEVVRLSGICMEKREGYVQQLSWNDFPSISYVDTSNINPNVKIGIINHVTFVFEEATGRLLKYLNETPETELSILFGREQERLSSSEMEMLARRAIASFIPKNFDLMSLDELGIRLQEESTSDKFRFGLTFQGYRFISVGGVGHGTPYQAQMSPYTGQLRSLIIDDLFYRSVDVSQVSVPSIGSEPSRLQAARRAYFATQVSHSGKFDSRRLFVNVPDYSRYLNQMSERHLSMVQRNQVAVMEEFLFTDYDLSGKEIGRTVVIVDTQTSEAIGLKRLASRDLVREVVAHLSDANRGVIAEPGSETGRKTSHFLSDESSRVVLMFGNKKWDLERTGSVSSQPRGSLAFAEINGFLTKVYHQDMLLYVKSDSGWVAYELQGGTGQELAGALEAIPNKWPSQ